jgi:putative transposase
MPRTARVAPGGVIFHVINRGNARMPIFKSDNDYAAFLRVLADALAAVPGVRLLAYCLMLNHWHLVLWPREDGELGRFMQRLTVTHVRRWHQDRGTTGGGHLYQGTYKSFPVQRDEPLLVVCRYIERNPLRAKLVRKAQDWRWSSLALRESDDRLLAGQLLSDWPVDRPSDWLKRVNAPQTDAEEQAVRDSILRGRPFGDAAWQKRTAARLGLDHTFRAPGRPRKKQKNTA